MEPPPLPGIASRHRAGTVYAGPMLEDTRMEHSIKPLGHQALLGGLGYTDIAPRCATYRAVRQVAFQCSGWAASSMQTA